MAESARAAPDAAALVNRRHIPFELDEGVAHRAAIGLIVLATDNTIEHEFREMLGIDGVAFYENRISNAVDINPETLAEMERGMTAAAEVILPGVPLAGVGSTLVCAGSFPPTPAAS